MQRQPTPPKTLTEIVQLASGGTAAALAIERIFNSANAFLGNHAAGFDQIYERLGVQPGYTIAGFGLVFFASLIYDDYRIHRNFRDGTKDDYS
jgi:hypothetical protein